LASVELSGTAVSRMSTMRIATSQPSSSAKADDPVVAALACVCDLSVYWVPRLRDAFAGDDA
jgi:hypothetical protein